MDFLIKKLPIAIAIVCISTIVILGMHSVIAVSIAIGLAVLSAFCVWYKIATTEKNTVIKPKRYLLISVMVAVCVGVGVYVVAG